MEAEMARISFLALLATLVAVPSAWAHDEGKREGHKGATVTTIVREGNRTNITIEREPRGNEPARGADTTGRGGK